jgi:hypothetical protein
MKEVGPFNICDKDEMHQFTGFPSGDRPRLQTE